VLEHRALLSTLVIPEVSLPRISATFDVTESGGSQFPTDQSVSGGNYLAALDGIPLVATYSVNLSLASLSFIPGPFNNASVTGDGTIYGTAVPNAGAISWLLTNLGPKAITTAQQDALQAAIWRTEYGSTFQLDGVDNGNSEGFFNATVAPIYQADLAALGSNTAPVNSVRWISPGTNLGQQGQGLVGLSPTPTPTVTPLPTPTPPPTAALVLPQTNVPGLEATFVKTESDGSASVLDENVAGGNFLGTYANTPLTASYCLSLTLPLSVPGTYYNTAATDNGTVYGALVPNAGAISWLLTNLGPSATTPVQQDALQAAIWREEYGDSLFEGNYDFQFDGVDNDSNQDNADIESTYQADLAALGTNTAPVSNVLWLTPALVQGTQQFQALVALPGVPTPLPTPSSTPPPTNTLALPNTQVQEFAYTYNQQSGQDNSGGNFLGTLGSTPLTATYCVTISLDIGPPITFNSAAVTSDGTIYGFAVHNAGAVAWLVANLGPSATTQVQQDALQAAIWREEYGNIFQVDGVDNSTEPNASANVDPGFVAAYRGDLAALGSNTAPLSAVFWISPGSGGGIQQNQGLVATAASASSPTPTPTPTNPTPTPTQTPLVVTNIAISGQSRKGLTAFSVSFNEAIVPASAQSLALYRVLGAVKSHRKTVYTKAVPIKSVSPGGSTVTINLRKPYKGIVQVTVGSGIMPANGATSNRPYSAIL
jgi:hypothetical protein